MYRRGSVCTLIQVMSSGFDTQPDGAQEGLAPVGAERHDGTFWGQWLAVHQQVIKPLSPDSQRTLTILLNDLST